MPTRRSSRQRIAASATPSPSVSPDEIASAVGTPVHAPLSRRAARERATHSLSTPAVEISAPTLVEADIDLSPMPASRRAQRHGAASVPIPDVRVEQILAESLVIVSPPTAPVDLPVEEPTTDVQETVVPVLDELVDDAPEDPVGDPAARPAAEDAFATASQTFKTQAGRRPTADASAQQGELDDEAASAHVVARRGRRPAMRKLVAAGATLGVMGVAGLLAVSMTLPAEAVAAAQGAQAMSAMSLVSTSAVAGGEELDDEEIQAFVASSDVADAKFERNEDYSTVSLVDLAAEQGIQYSDSLYTNDPEAQIQWPFVVGVAMSSGYGQRWGRLHAGIDLVPGNGAPIQVIADGTVRIATESGGAYGVTVYVDHIIDGQVVTSHYAHMQYGSLRVKAGDKVKVGDIVGLVGNTGRSYGAHLHFEIIINGSTVNPLPWMQENAGRHEGVTPVS